MHPDKEERKRGPGQGHRALEIKHTNADEYRATGSITQAQVADLDDIRFQRAVSRLHRLGERSFGEMLIELGARFLIRTEIEKLIERYINNLDPATVAAVGGRQFAPVPLHPVGAP